MGARGAVAVRPQSELVEGGTGKDEIEHESKNRDCLYLGRAPFVTLLREILSTHLPDVKLTKTAAGWIQFIIESLLIKIMFYAGGLVNAITKGHGGPTAMSQPLHIIRSLPTYDFDRWFQQLYPAHGP